MKKKILMMTLIILILFICGFKFYRSNSYGFSFQGTVAIKENSKIFVVKGLTDKQILNRNQKYIMDEISLKGDMNTTAGWIRIDNKKLLKKIKVGDKIEAFSKGSAIKDLLPFEMNAEKIVIIK